MKQRNLIPLINDIISESVLAPELKYLHFSPKEVAKFNNKDRINIIRRKSDVSDILVGDYIKPEWNKIYLVTAINQFLDVADCPSFQSLSETEMMEFVDLSEDEIPVVEIQLEQVIKKETQRFFYDCEFDETKPNIELISIGIVSEDGKELYLINKDYNWNLCESQWLIDNVKPYVVNAPDYYKVSYNEIGKRIIDFIKPSLLINTNLYGYYSAYDHVVLCKTFGTMMNLPEGMPMYTRDLQQYLDYFGINKDKLLKNSQVNEHDALADARWNYRLYLAIKRLMGVEL